MAGNVAIVRGLLERVDELADLQVPALRSVRGFGIAAALV
jgi:hypothetical protein